MTLERCCPHSGLAGASPRCAAGTGPADRPGTWAACPITSTIPLPLRIERSKTELRIEVQSVLAELAQELRVDDSADGTSLTRALGDAAKLLSHVRAPKAADALQQALDLLQAPSAGQVGQDEPSPPDHALAVLRQGLAT